jgi:hypothetical protein
MIEHSSKSKGYLPVKSGPNQTGFYMGNSNSLMEMMQTGGSIPSAYKKSFSLTGTPGGATLARALQRRRDADTLEEYQREEAKRQERGALFGSIGKIGGGLLGAALAPATGGASLAIASGLGTAIGQRLGEGIGAGKSREYDSSGTVFGQQAFRDVERASRDYTRGMGERALVSGLQAGLTAGFSPDGGIYGETSRRAGGLRPALAGTVGYGGASLPVAPSVERVVQTEDPFGDPSLFSDKIFDPSSVFSASTYNPMASLSGPSLAGGSFLSDMQDGGLIEYQNGGSVNVQNILQDAGITATPQQLALFESFDPTELTQATEAISDSLLGMTSGQGLASAGTGFGARTSAIGETVARGQESLEQQRQAQQKAFESQTLGQAASMIDQGAEFGAFGAPPPTVSTLPTADQGPVTFNGVGYVWDNDSGQYITQDQFEQGMSTYYDDMYD